MDLYQEAFSTNQAPPEETQIMRVLSLVDPGAIRIQGRTVRFAKDGMGVTLDGIAKGYAIDCGMNSLQNSGIRQALINAGGDIRTIGGPGRFCPWKIAVQNPDKDRPPLQAFAMRDGAAATSGNYQVYYDEGSTITSLIRGRPVPPKAVAALRSWPPAPPWPMPSPRQSLLPAEERQKADRILARCGMPACECRRRSLHVQPVAVGWKHFYTGINVILLGCGILLLITAAWFAVYYWITPHLDEPDGQARVAGTCGDVMEIRLKFKGGRMVDGSAWTNGCALSFNCVWAAVDQAKGKTPEEILDIDSAMIQDAVGGLPKDHWHCAFLSIDTLHAAIDNYMQAISGSCREQSTGP